MGSLGILGYGQDLTRKIFIPPYFHLQPGDTPGQMSKTLVLRGRFNGHAATESDLAVYAKFFCGHCIGTLTVGYSFLTHS